MQMEHQLPIDKWLAFVRTGPHEFTIQYPPRPEYFADNFSAELPPSGTMRGDSPRLLYVHVPFCAQRCSYCIFATDARTDAEVMDRYVHALLTELPTNPLVHAKKVKFINVGGGTPTILPTSLFESLLGELSTYGGSDEDSERSIETTPEELCREPHKACIAQDSGFHRISLGVQTSSESTLRHVGRDQVWDNVVQAYETLRSVGTRRVNLDLIFGLPNQDLSRWQNDVARVAELRPDSITTYDCLYRGNDRELVTQKKKLPSIDLLGHMYDWAYDYLTARGYLAEYGSVNYSLHGGETGTSKYFERRILWGEPYVGIGNYATSLVQGCWTFNCRDVDTYAHRVLSGIDPIEFHYELPPDERYAKYVLYSLNFGVIMPQRFAELFGCDLWSVYGNEIAYAMQEGWLEEYPNGDTLGVKKFSYIHLLRSLFYSDAAKRWLIRWCGKED